MSEPSPWWQPQRHADRRPVLLARNRIKSAVRAWFESQGFVEVETGCLQVSPGNETHLHAFATELIGTDLSRQPLYLNTSPEFACKKLLAAGEPKIFTFAHSFRNRERGALHVPEFVMLEWYRAGEPYETLWDDCAAIMKIAADVTGHSPWTYRGKVCAPRATPQRLTLAQAFSQYAGIALGETFTTEGADRAALARLAAAHNIRFGADDTWSDIFSRVLVERIEPALGMNQPSILCEYPIHEAALARPHPKDNKVAERFELYVCGIELANGFGELTDPAKQRANLQNQMTERARIYGEKYPLDEDFLAALAHMPPSSGCALGFDRLIMLSTGVERVDDVIWTPMPGPGHNKAP